MLLVDAALADDRGLAISAATIIEVQHKGVSRPRMSWVLSRMRVHDVTKDSARAAAALLQEAGLHGHKYAIDAMVAEMALRQSPPVSLLTSDGDDMARLCGRRVRLITV
ncbi:DNA-binding protein [Streptomyces sp. 8K308]|uniref:DNA-binding protein n=1 Tax=Streptomyces sp. 8K308 TaxID=2530388 RepID=UPI001FB7FFEB|nr:DNA-binding protein [Streptomyces sp. 8K308]